ncbi:hypothetical protein LT679_10400 [Mucilaginibacter roseus]|uniref:DUF4998 domain-containing protein n=1 Tax=Mucilaginibacter roseus TaxID=1528868 RepID=A0ABS8U3Z8_9SPHI|nr:hypothetical protein [Mucilaginibacter roseus]MCD8741012.1 hypothetical protein [Mucilaginibacter roseus]
MLKLVTVCSLLMCAVACKQKTDKKTSSAADTITKQDSTPKETVNQQPKYINARFLNYNDDGDYFILLAQHADSSISFINDDGDRSLNRGDSIEVLWKDDNITMAGDDEIPVPAKRIISIRKIADGPVTLFKKSYGRQIKYTWAPEESFSEYYLDKIYKLVEYYLATTKTELLLRSIKAKEAINYSLESQEREGRQYTMIGIAVPGTNGSNIVQWLYVDDETSQLFEYDLGNDKLIPVK